MSIKAVSVVLAATIPDRPARPDLDPVARYGSSGRVLKLILLGLADRADELGQSAWPGIRNLSLAAQCTMDTTRIGLVQLRLDQLIWRTHHGDERHADVYALDLSAILELVPKRAGHPRSQPPVDELATRALRAGQTRAPARGSGPAHNAPTSVHPATTDVVASLSTCIECGRPVPRTRFRCAEQCTA